MSDNALGKFLRACREALDPAEVGLPVNARRRTPGLRRAELATLAGLSVDYLNRLEQGRDRNPSGQVLAALADALRLTPEQRRHLLNLSKHAAGNRLCPVTSPPEQAVRPTVRALLERLEPSPAVVTSWVADVLATTAGYRRLVGPIGVLDTPAPNLARFLFTDPRARTAYPDWDRVADAQAAAIATAARAGDPYAHELAEELMVTAGTVFANRFSDPNLMVVPTGRVRLLHPTAGELRLDYETLDLPGNGDRQLTVYLAADQATAAALTELAAADSPVATGQPVG
ncbi:MAG TPA: helix-turn-helix domain-containing protein [Natronosporangium sp.]